MAPRPKVPSLEGIENLSDEELSLLKRRLDDVAAGREENRKAKAREAAIERLKKIKDIPIQFIDALFPYHDRSTCSNENISNGWWTAESGPGARCAKCALLEIRNGIYDPDGKIVELSLEIRISDP